MSNYEAAVSCPDCGAEMTIIVSPEATVAARKNAHCARCGRWLEYDLSTGDIIVAEQEAGHDRPR